jgi:hypothetical protein
VDKRRREPDALVRPIRNRQPPPARAGGGGRGTGSSA